LEWRRDGELVIDPREVVVISDEGATVDEISLHPDRDIDRLDLSPSGNNLIYSTSGGELVWYSLESADAEVLLERRMGFGAHFLTNHEVIAVGSEGVQIVDLNSNDAVTTLGFGRGAVDVAYDEERGLAATMSGSGAIRLWDIDTGQQVGPGSLHRCKRFNRTPNNEERRTCQNWISPRRPKESSPPISSCQATLTPRGTSTNAFWAEKLL
jgi:hypothetical protein